MATIPNVLIATVFLVTVMVFVNLCHAVDRNQYFVESKGPMMLVVTGDKYGKNVLKPQILTYSDIAEAPGTTYAHICGNGEDTITDISVTNDMEDDMSSVYIVQGGIDEKFVKLAFQRPTGSTGSKEGYQFTVSLAVKPMQ